MDANNQDGGSASGSSDSDDVMSIVAGENQENSNNTTDRVEETALSSSVSPSNEANTHIVPVDNNNNNHNESNSSTPIPTETNVEQKQHQQQNGTAEAQNIETEASAADTKTTTANENITSSNNNVVAASSAPSVDTSSQGKTKRPKLTAPTSTTTTTTTTASTVDPHSLLPQPPAEPRIYYRATEENAAFQVISNDNSERNLVWLVSLKEIFAKQLPKMPREYIVRLLFDRQHQSLLCLEGEEQTVVGGISFKPYPEQKFAEIAFCAVSATHQVKGYGTRLMNHLKEYCKRVNLTHFLTYADNFAIGYFKKQGFSSQISMPRERWFGYIKDYDGGTLMECVVSPAIDYFKIPDLIKRQRQFLLDKIEQKAKAPEHVYMGLQGHIRGDKIEDPYLQIPGLKEAGWVKPMLPTTTSSSHHHHTSKHHHQNAADSVANIARALLSNVVGQELQTVLKAVVDQVSAHRDSWPFHEPVPPSVVDYLEIVKEPIDLSLIRARVNNLSYPSAGHLRRDLHLMLTNCTTYNRPDTTYFKAALGLQKLVNDMFGDIACIGDRTGAEPVGSADVPVAAPPAPSTITTTPSLANATPPSSLAVAAPVQ